MEQLLYIEDQRGSTADSTDCVIDQSESVSGSTHEAGTETLFELAEKIDYGLNASTQERPTESDCSEHSKHSSEEDSSRCCDLDPLEPESEASHNVSQDKSISEFVMEQFRSEHFPSCTCTSELSEHTHSLWSDNADSDAVLASMPDLYIYEKDPGEFILGQAVNPLQLTPPEHQMFLKSGGIKADYHKHVPLYDLQSIAAPCHNRLIKEQVMEHDPSVLCKLKELQPAAVDALEMAWMSVNDEEAEKADINIQLQPSDSPVDLWLDACQFLTVEEAEDQEVLDEEGQAASFNPCFSSAETSVSGSKPNGNRWANWSTRPPVERWSSVDSWATAQSDWSGVVGDPPEDITAAFAEIGAEIDALTQALEEVEVYKERGTLKEDQNQEQVPNITGVQVSAGGGVELLCDPEDTAAVEPRAEEIQGPSLTEVSLTTLPALSGDFDLAQFDKFEREILNDSENNSVKLQITEDTDLGASNKLLFEKHFGSELRQVAEDCGSPKLGLEDKQEVEHEGGEDHARLDIFVVDPLTNSDEPKVDIRLSQHTNVLYENFVEDLLASQEDLVRPKFNMRLDSPRSWTHDSNSLGCDLAQHCLTTDGSKDNVFLTEDEILSKQESISHAKDSSSHGRLSDLDDNDAPQSSDTGTEEITDLKRDLANFTIFPGDHLFISDESRVACITLDLNDPFVVWTSEPILIETEPEQAPTNMPHKTPKNPSESKTHSKKEKAAGHHQSGHIFKKAEFKPQQACDKEDGQLPTGENQTEGSGEAGLDAKEAKLMIETSAASEKSTGRPHGKKKKKHGPNTALKNEGKTSNETGNETKPKNTNRKTEVPEAKLGAKAGKPQRDEKQAFVDEKKSQQLENKELHMHETNQKDHQPKNFTLPNDDAIKRRRVSGDKFEKIVHALEKPDVSAKAKAQESQTDTGIGHRKAYSEVVKQKIPHKEEIKVVEAIQAAAVSGELQSLLLWCQFSGNHSDCTVTWSRDGVVLAEIKRSAGDESRVSLIIGNASHKDLGKYECRLSSLHASVVLDYLLTYEVLSEIIIPVSLKASSSAPVDVCSEEEDAHCSRLFFKEDFLSDQYFSENEPISIITEKVHFGEGMHRRAFRTKLKAGQIPLLVPGHSCVLKVHNSISYGTKNNDELLQKNFNLAVEECQVQNTAREYIKAYTTAAQSVETFGDIPEIIPIYLIHRPSNDIPYATLEEELIGNFVKYSVRDGKEINVMRRDSEAGQKCCTFQHWVYQSTEGNLLVTDMQGVGMKLTDVGIATCKKGYKGFKGNCATSFIDQFKALHQCNRYCEILGLRSLQPKAKKASAAPKPNGPPSGAPKKKVFGPTVKKKT